MSAERESKQIITHPAGTLDYEVEFSRAHARHTCALLPGLFTSPQLIDECLKFFLEHPYSVVIPSKAFIIDRHRKMEIGVAVFIDELNVNTGLIVVRFNSQLIIHHWSILVPYLA